MEAAIINVKRLYKSSIKEISELYADDTDYEGLFFWAEDSKVYIEEINKSFGDLK